MQVHVACILCCLQRLLGPQGDGLHGSLSKGAVEKNLRKFIQQFQNKVVM